MLKALDALVEPHDQRRGHASGSQCAVRAHQHDGHAASATRSAGIAVDTKKKELVGPFKNGEREWQPKGEPKEVDRHDFPDLQLGKVISSGVVDLSQNEGWVSVRIAVARGVSEARLPGTRSASRCRFSQRIG